MTRKGTYWNFHDAITFEALNVGLNMRMSQLCTILLKSRDYLERVERCGIRDMLQSHKYDSCTMQYWHDGKQRLITIPATRYSDIQRLVDQYLMRCGNEELRRMVREKDSKEQIAAMIYIGAKHKQDHEMPLVPAQQSLPSPESSRESEESEITQPSTHNPLFSRIAHTGQTIKGRANGVDSGCPTIQEYNVKSEMPASKRSKVTADEGNVTGKMSVITPWECSFCHHANERTNFCQVCDAAKAMTTEHLPALSPTRRRSLDRHYSPPSSSVIVQKRKIGELFPDRSLEAVSRNRAVSDGPHSNAGSQSVIASTQKTSDTLQKDGIKCVSESERKKVALAAKNVGTEIKIPRGPRALRQAAVDEKSAASSAENSLTSEQQQAAISSRAAALDHAKSKQDLTTTRPDKVGQSPALALDVQTSTAVRPPFETRAQESSDREVEVKLEQDDVCSINEAQTDIIPQEAALEQTEEPSNNEVTDLSISVVEKPDLILSDQQWNMIDRIVKVTRMSERSKALVTLKTCLEQMTQVKLEEEAVIALFFAHAESTHEVQRLRELLRLLDDKIIDDHTTIDHLLSMGSDWWIRFVALLS